MKKLMKNIGQHLAHRLNPKTILLECYDTITGKIIPQGADEVSRALNTGRAYSPYGYPVPKPRAMPAKGPPPLAPLQPVISQHVQVQAPQARTVSVTAPQIVSPQATTLHAPGMTPAAPRMDAPEASMSEFPEPEMGD